MLCIRGKEYTFLAFAYFPYSVLGENKDLNIPPRSASQPRIAFGGHGFDKLVVLIYGASLQGDTEAVSKGDL